MVYKRGKIFHYDFSIGGQRYRGSTEQTTKTAADQYESTLKTRIRERGNRWATVKSPTLRQLSSEFLAFVERSSLDDDTKLYYANGYRLLADTELADMALNVMTRNRIDMVRFPASGSNANCALRTLRRMLSYAVDENMLHAAPKIRLRKENQRSAIIDPGLEERILAAVSGDLRDAFLMVQDAGCRPDEVVRMRWPNVIWDRRLMLVERGKTGRARRYVPLSDRLAEALREREKKAKSQWVFPSARSKTGHMHQDTLTHAFTELKQLLGMPEDIVLYSGRHTFATDLLEQTGNIKLVADVLGHASVTTTARYVHPETSKVADFVNARNQQRHKMRHNSSDPGADDGR